MGVDTNFVVMYGVRLEGQDSEDFYDSYNEQYDYEETEDFDTVHDGMSGEYTLVGVQLAYLYHYDNEEDHKVIKIDRLESKRTKMLATLKEKFPQHFHLFDKPWDIIVQIHYT